MKLKTQWLIGILGLTALISSPAVAQNTPLQDFFNGLPPYTGDDIIEPRNRTGNRETSNDDAEVRESTQDATPATNRNLTEQENNTPTQSENQLQRDARPTNQPYQPGSVR